MKKLILLAVVVFGFAATSLAQKDASSNVNVQLQLPTNPNAGMSISWVNDMDFGKINYDNKAGTVKISPAGNISSYPIVGAQKAATFAIKGLLNGNPDLIVSPSIVTSIGTNATFETNSTLEYLSYTDLNNGNYTVKLGGKITLPANFGGTISIPAVTVTLNNN